MGFFSYFIFFDSGATPFFPEQFAAMPRTSMCLKKWGTERSEVSNGRGVQTPGVLPWKFKKQPCITDRAIRIILELYL